LRQSLLDRRFAQSLCFAIEVGAQARELGLDRLRRLSGLFRDHRFRRRAGLAAPRSLEFAPVVRFELRDQGLQVGKLLLRGLLQLRHRRPDFEAEDVDLPSLDHLHQVFEVEDGQGDDDHRPHEDAQIVENQAPELVPLPAFRRHRALLVGSDVASAFDRGVISSRSGCAGQQRSECCAVPRQPAALRLAALPQAGSQSCPSTSATRPPSSKNLFGTWKMPSTTHPSGDHA
jgi:hypothetical protein